MTTDTDTIKIDLVSATATATGWGIKVVAHRDGIVTTYLAVHTSGGIIVRLGATWDATVNAVAQTLKRNGVSGDTFDTATTLVDAAATAVGRR